MLPMLEAIDLPCANFNAESANQNIARSKASMFLARPVEGIPIQEMLRFCEASLLPHKS